MSKTNAISPRLRSKATDVSSHQTSQINRSHSLPDLYILTIEKKKKMAENHFKRVTNFAKEMLVWPTEIDVHKIKNEAYVSES